MSDQTATPDAAETTETTALPSAVSVRLSPDETRLLADFDPAGDKSILDVAKVGALLRERGYSRLHVDATELAKFLKQCATAAAPFTVQIGERRDAECIIGVSDDAMTVEMTLNPARGGQEMTRERLGRILREKDVSYGILENEIATVLAAQATQKRVIARGKPPVDGTDASFENLAPEAGDRRPRVDENGIADYRELGEFVVVRQGDALMRRTPAQPGENGVDVHGHVILAKAGKDVPFASGLSGATADPNDANLLAASITGQPVAMGPNGVRVDPTITVKEVNLATGNVRFDGAVRVKGDVRSGMKIQATGDVIVDGTVESAWIEAGGDLVIRGGVIGSGEAHLAGEATRARLSCKGTLRARFLENVHARAGVDILIGEFSMQSELVAQHQILVGKPGSGKGHIRGGHVCASSVVSAAVIGTTNGMRTIVEVGHSAAIGERLKKIGEEFQRCEREQEKIEQVISFLQKHPDNGSAGKLEKARLTLGNFHDELERLREEQVLVKQELQVIEGAQVHALSAAHAGVEIRIGDATFRAMEDTGPRVFHLVGGEIVGDKQ